VTEEFVSAVDEVNDHFGNAGKGDRACNSRWRSLCEGLIRMSMNTISSGSDRINDIQDHLQGEIRGQTKLVKITEDVPKYTVEQGVSEEEALQKGMEEKSREFTQKGNELYAKA
jgi:hypothetical protein